IEAQIHALIEYAALLDEVRHRMAAQLAVSGRSGFACRITGPIAESQALIHDGAEVAAVIGPSGRRCIWNPGVRDEVAPPHLFRGDAERASRLVDQAFHDVNGFRPAGTAVRARIGGIGEHALESEVNSLDIVRAGHEKL